MTDKNTFDPATHTFGMAYEVKDFPLEGILYPFAVRKDKRYDCFQIEENGEKYLSDVEYDCLIRAPEHDLVPRAPVTDDTRPDCSDVSYMCGQTTVTDEANWDVVKGEYTDGKLLQPLMIYTRDSLGNPKRYQQDDMMITPVGAALQSDNELVEALVEWKRRLEKHAYKDKGHVCDAVNACKSVAQSIDAALAKHRKNGE